MKIMFTNTTYGWAREGGYQNATRFGIPLPDVKPPFTQIRLPLYKFSAWEGVGGEYADSIIISRPLRRTRGAHGGNRVPARGSMVAKGDEAFSQKCYATKRGLWGWEGTVHRILQ